MFLSQYFSFPLSVPFHHCSILIFIYKLLLKGTNGLRLETFRKSGSILLEQCFHLFFKNQQHWRTHVNTELQNRRFGYCI